ncbi:cell division protein FtsX [Caldisericum exile]|uniref:Cell division protein FtsX n=1 Tax=Caldisericum exile (strain DSM 21853 / NBRC 104410 / AZM16c01) TaxID=511051 RepID=A0A7U6GF09_CALEA|nr:permease-like cell division protein FtsX [Caldisericum exile]BAL81178.1 cell division protein FtsX [Caldisericum exile AZM16c01]
MYRLFYVLRHTLLVLKETKKIAFITVLSLLVGMLALGSTYIIGTKLFQSSLTLKEKVRIVVFFKQNLNSSDVESSVSTIRSIDGVKSVTLTTPEQAKDEFIKIFPQYQGILTSLGRNPLPYSATVELNDISLGKRITDIIKDLQTVDVVVFSEDTANKINNLINVIYVIFLSVMLAVFAEFIFTVQNTTTLLLDYRRNDIRVLRLIGADAVFTFIPFTLIVVFLNLVAWVISYYLIGKVNELSTGIVQGIIPYATVSSNVNFNVTLFALLIFSVVSSLIGSLISVLRFRNVK